MDGYWLSRQIWVQKKQGYQILFFSRHYILTNLMISACSILYGITTTFLLFVIVSFIYPIHTYYVLFYSPTCPYCKPVVPKFRCMRWWPWIGKQVVLVDVNEPHPFNVDFQGVPSMMAIDAKTGEVINQNNDRSFAGIMGWIASS